MDNLGFELVWPELPSGLPIQKTASTTRMSIATSSEIAAAIRHVLGDTEKSMALHEPLFRGNENNYVKSCIDEGWVSSVGSFVNKFESELASRCETEYAVVMVNGTCALHAALLCMGVQPGDEVLIPSLTFIATANAVKHAGAVPHFVDVEEYSLGIDPIKLQKHLKRIAISKSGRTLNKQTGRLIKALLPVHIFGHPCQMEALAALAHEWNLELLEDATEALGSKMGGQPIGSSNTAVFSFNGNKIITTGGGGAVVTRDEVLFQRLKHLTTTAKRPHPWAFVHDEVGYNYRMPNINAALGCAQLEQLSLFLDAKRALATEYIRTFSGLKGVNILSEPANTQSNYWLVTLVAERSSEVWLEETLSALHQSGLLCRPIWRPAHQLPMYGACPRDDLSCTDSLAYRIINLPSSVHLGLRFLNNHPIK